MLNTNYIKNYKIINFNKIFNNIQYSITVFKIINYTICIKKYNICIKKYNISILFEIKILYYLLCIIMYYYYNIIIIKTKNSI